MPNLRSAEPDVIGFGPAEPVLPRRPGRPRSQALTSSVLDAAYRLCASEGLRGATIQAISSESGVSKMTIYKWWDGRLPLLIDAFLQQATALLPLAIDKPSAAALHAHALRYVSALRGELGRVHLAVLAECLAEQGDATLFVERYLKLRRKLGAALIAQGQADGTIVSQRAPEALWDQIYGTIFYRFQFGLAKLDKRFINELIETTLKS